MAEDNILSYIDRLNPTSALIGASNMLLNRLQGAGVVPRVDGSYAPKRTNTGERSRGSRRGTGLRSRQEQGVMYGTLPPSVNQNLGAYDESVTLPNVGSAGNAGGYNPIRQNQSFGASPLAAPALPPEERAYQTELARTQQMAAANPYFQQMDLYAQGQRAMQTQEDMDKVRDLGLAINRSMYGDMTTPRTPNQLMAGLTPPGPAQPVIPMDEEGRIGQLDAAAAGVQDFMRKYAEGMKKRKGEE
jgi:hypothetical protein